MAQKGPSGRRELDEALYAMRLLSVTCEEQEQLRLPPAEEERLLLVFRKLQGTPPRYPREPRLIREKPL